MIKGHVLKKILSFHSIVSHAQDAFLKISLFLEVYFRKNFILNFTLNCSINTFMKYLFKVV